MGRVALSIIFTLLFAAALLYAQIENPEPITVNLGTLAKGWRPYLFEIALFPALILFVFALLLSLSRSSKQDTEQKQALEAAQARLREQEERLTALEAQLRTVGMLPVEETPAAAEESNEEDHSSSHAASKPPKEIPADDAPRVRVSRAIH